MRDLTLLRSIRLAELHNAMPFLPPHGRVLELGAGAGWQAAHLQQNGYQVTALETDSNHYAGSTTFPLTAYDGYSIPAADGSFDAVFSSNVLEHVADIERLLKDSLRVLAPGGVAVHILPNPVWRLWSIAVHPLWFARRSIQSLLPARNAAGEAAPPEIHKHVARGLVGSALANLVPMGHGERGNVWTEAYYFSAAYWNKTFRACGFEVAQVRPAGFFYTSGGIFGSRLDPAGRHRLVAVLGASCTIYCLKRR